MYIIGIATYLVPGGVVLFTYWFGLVCAVFVLPFRDVFVSDQILKLMLNTAELSFSICTRCYGILFFQKTTRRADHRPRHVNVDTSGQTYSQVSNSSDRELET